MPSDDFRSVISINYPGGPDMGCQFKVRILQAFIQKTNYHSDDVMVCVLAVSVVDRWVEPRSGQTKYICTIKLVFAASPLSKR